ncbi:twin-arginine translocation pathway signal [Caulobacter sp. Root655]|uniref:DUF885 domain-containing protein n=1 Tax=Caulobacter sp. Root655 TaxID=1736578 RepID=UPI0006F3292E|nr:DUF885 family protein [Caulobacter sp. Root655]KRA56780.1 twin-arginine translocation pathway signal [Caulobacter sp. Root655]
MSQFNRRDVLALGGAALATAATGGAALAAAPGDAAAEALLSGVAEDLMREYPENASALGLDKGARAGLKATLTDRSLEGRARLAAAAKARVAAMKAVDRKGLSPAAALDLGVVQTAHELAVEGFDFAYGDAIGLSAQWSYRNAPYVVAQNTGAFVEIPDFLDSQHGIANAADADAYLARLELYAAALDGETARLKHDGGLGVVAPDFLLDKTLKQMKGARAQPVGEWGLVTALAKKVQGAPGDHVRRAAAIAESRIAPAMDRQIAELTAHRARATGDAGAWKLPDGEAYYAWALRAGTTSTLSPDAVHAMGLEQVRELSARMDVLLKAQGLSQGTVGARMKALGEDPKNLFPNTDAGRAQILAYLNGRVADIRTRLPRAFNTLAPGNLIIKRVPVEIQDGAPGGYAGAGSIDGTVPGNYYINLRDTGIWPRYALPTLTYHEGIPGHIWQGEYTYKLPLARSLLAFNAYSEGWALYAEQLADELGAYDDDPLGRRGYLQSIAFRACRLVVDTGIHAKRWSRQQAIDWFVTTNGSTEQEVSGEVDRYCAWPGQACGYKVGHSEIVRLRTKAQAALGARFQLGAFDDAVVMGGNVPLTQLEGVIDRYIAGR